MATPEAKAKAKLKTHLKRIHALVGRRLRYNSFAGSPYGGATLVDYEGIARPANGAPGVFWAVEVKRFDGEGKLTARQRMTLSEISDAGGYPFIVDSDASLAEFVEWLENVLGVRNETSHAQGASGSRS